MMNEEIVTPKNVHEIIGSRMLADGYDLVLDLERSRGMMLYDSRNNRKFLDFFGFFASNPVGMNHPDMLEPTFLENLQLAALNKVTNSDIYTTQMADFVETFSKSVTPRYMKYFFFIDGGTLAVENALKAAFDWKVKKNIKKGVNGEKGTRIMHLKEAFHGRSGYTLSLTNTFDPRKTQYFPKFEWPRVINPKLSFPVDDKVIKEVEKLEDLAISQMEGYFKLYKDDIAAFIMEPIQGEGGDNHFRKEFFKRAIELVHENDSLFIVDEVQSGMGITGKWWAHQHFDIEPDMIAFGKKSQVCGIMVGEKIDEVEDNVFHVSSRINSTWGGNLADMVRATKYIEIMEKHKLVQNAEKVGKIMVDRLNSIHEKYPALFQNPRGRGLMDAFDLKSEKARDEFYNKMYSKGIFTLKAAEKTIRLRPPLIASEADVNALEEKVIETLREM
jgi:L-lysine 6-transaminase